MTKKKWCDYSDLSTDQCAHCRGLEVEDDDAPEDEFEWQAKFDGTCERCREPFLVKEWIRRDPSGFGYIHMDCV